MVSQLSLWTDQTREQGEDHLCVSGLARASDPKTSKQAADIIRPKLSGLRAEFVARLKVLKVATAQEVAAGKESLRKRAKELVDLGAIKVVGVKECSVTGKNATAYEVVE